VLPRFCSSSPFCAFLRQTVASLVLIFAAYVAADGAFAILAGMRAVPRDERWRLLILEGATNLAAAAAVLAWPAIVIAAPFVRLACAWAVVTEALLLAAAHRLSGSLGPGSGGCGVGRLGALAAAADAGNPDTIRLWLVGYAVVFGGALLALADNCENDTGDQLQLPATACDHLTRSVSCPIPPFRVGRSSRALRGCFGRRVR